MKTILTFNVGSSSVKASLFVGTTLFWKKNFEYVTTTKQRHAIVRQIASFLKKEKITVDVVAHRIVHGGPLTKHSLINPKLLKNLKSIAQLAPLHDIPEIEVIEFAQKNIAKKNIAIFDTAFHQSKPLHAAMYGLPISLAKKGIVRYGFHGISHEYATKNHKGNVISCHLGSGSSISAIKNGRCVENSMGFTPLEGLVMGTRCGTIDPSIPLYLQDQGYSRKKIKHILNSESGILGVSGISNDMRDLMPKYNKDRNARLAIDLFVYTVVKTIGAYATVLGGCNTLIFTAGIGENAPMIRQKICENLSLLGVKIDPKKNAKNAPIISTKSSKVRVIIVKADEELAMAKIALRF
ncbi:MAG TPA: acetate/propionate family kinase [Acidobacteriota bacterium]|nr:acetate/propionate family kinase [Acidobacteriota bacterium]